MSTLKNTNAELSNLENKLHHLHDSIRAVINALDKMTNNLGVEIARTNMNEILRIAGVEFEKCHFALGLITNIEVDILPSINDGDSPNGL